MQYYIEKIICQRCFDITSAFYTCAICHTNYCKNHAKEHIHTDKEIKEYQSFDDIPF